MGEHFPGMFYKQTKQRIFGAVNFTLQPETFTVRVARSTSSVRSERPFCFPRVERAVGQRAGGRESPGC